MLLAGDGKLSLDSAVAAYIDSSPPAWAGITVRHLLNHTSGIFAGGIVLHDGSPLQSVTTKQAFRQIAAARAFGPGRTGFYSDAGYFLAGLIIEKVSGQSYASFMRSRFFEPLGMANTTLTDRRRVIKGRVSTYEIVDGQHVNWRRDWDYELPSFFGIWSTLDDVAKWDNALRRATPLSRAMLDEMWSAGRLSDGRDALVDSRLYGLGFRLLDIRGHRVVSHTGASGTLLLHLLEEPLSVIVLTNLSSTAGRHGTSLGNGIVGLLRPGYRPVQLLQSGHDSNPELTRALQTLLADVSAGRESPTMTPAHAAHFRGRPPIARTEITRDLTGLGPLALISCDEVAGRGVRYTDPITRICYYRAVAAGRNSIFTFYLTQDSRVAHMRWAGEDEL
jgi:CubicO group peptidase (beta-lactamase class C family)